MVAWLIGIAACWWWRAWSGSVSREPVGSSDRIFVSFDIPYRRQIEVLGVVWLLLPPVVFLLTLSTCRRRLASGIRPLRGWTGQIVTRRRDGSFRDRAPGG